MCCLCKAHALVQSVILYSQEPLYSERLGTKKRPDYRGVFNSGLNLHREGVLGTSYWEVLNTESVLISGFQ